MKKHSLKQFHSFLLLWGSQTVSQLGTAMTDYAVIIWVFSQKGTASSVTLLTICTFLPTIFLRFLAGSLVDRQNKKRVMLTADLVAACRPDTRLCVAADITCPTEFIRTKSMAGWQKELNKGFTIGKRPCVFILLA